MIRIKFIIPLILFSLLFIACGEEEPEEADLYVEEILEERKAKDWELENDRHSPFNLDTTITFSELKYYDPDPEFVFESKLYTYESQDTVIIMGTKGEERKTIRIGYLNINYKDETHKLNVYKAFSRTGQEYYSLWFTDETTGNETYGVGRYIDFDLSPDPDYVYTIDFNKAYNPYCAYSAEFSCPIPSKDDHLAFEIKAGEKNYH